MKTHFLGLIAIATLAAATPAMAQPDGAVAANKTIFDAEGKRIGKIDRVLDDGAVTVIYRGKVVKIAADTISTDEGKVKTSLTRKEL
ncbi:MAG: hypothetical protein R3E02_13350 [Blastomonas sp.]